MDKSRLMLYKFIKIWLTPMTLVVGMKGYTII